VKEKKNTLSNRRGRAVPSNYNKKRSRGTTCGNKTVLRQRQCEKGGKLFDYGRTLWVKERKNEKRWMRREKRMHSEESEQ